MKPTKFTFLIALVALLCSSCVKSKIDYTKQIQTELDHEISENNPGILVNINSVDKDFVWNGASGVSDKEEKSELNPDQTFRIASVTKTFVAATILRLWEDGKLRLDDPIAKYVAEEHINILKSGGYKVDQILIRHLLTHSSGLAEHTQSHKFTLDFMNTRHVWSRSETITDLITYAKPVGEVGAQFSYSDTGYILLGEIIERITGKSMGDAIMEQLNLKALGLNDTYMEEFDGDFTGRRVHQYHENADTYNFHPSLDYYGGGGLLSTTADLSIFYQKLFAHKIFTNKSTLDKMLEPVVYNTEQSLDYRMGIWKMDIDGKEAYSHSGFWGTQVVYLPEIKTAIAVNYSQHWPQRGVAPIIPAILKVITENN